jgi:hypothetical protein
MKYILKDGTPVEVTEATYSTNVTINILDCAGPSEIRTKMADALTKAALKESL